MLMLNLLTPSAAEPPQSPHAPSRHAAARMQEIFPDQDAVAHARRMQICRAEIDRMDDRILEALELRARAVAQLGVIKRDFGTPIYDHNREQQVLDHIATAGHTLPSHRRRAIFATIIAQMREWQATLD